MTSESFKDVEVWEQLYLYHTRFIITTNIENRNIDHVVTKLKYEARCSVRPESISKNLTSNTIPAKIIIDDHKGNLTVIPKTDLAPNDTNLPFIHGLNLQGRV